METINYRGYNIKVEADYDPMSCREWDNVGIMVCSHKRYNLGDEHDIAFDDFSSWDEVEAHLREDYDAIEVLPLYLYDHSGITMNTTGFSCPWDSGQVGLIYTNKEQMDYIGLSSDTPSERIREILDGEVVTYDMYLRGEVYGFEVETADGEFIDACSGFYGDPEESGLLAEAKGIVDYEVSKLNRKLACTDFSQLASFLV